MPEPIALETPTTDVSAGQIAAGLAYAVALLLWIYSRCLINARHVPPAKDAGSESDSPSAQAPLLDSLAKREGSNKCLSASGSNAADEDRPSPSPRRGIRSGLLACLCQSTFIKVVCLDQEAVVAHANTIAAAAEFGTLMLWFFLADRTSLFPFAAKSYSRDVFLVIFLALSAVAFGSSLQKESRPMTLSRHQTEEWKGWMQVLFLLYHYFEAREAYNAIRVFIAGYVWMTGYGNFHYYYKTNDYCIGRFAQMMWRLNFLVFACCVVLRNSYMLYYICPMHTIYTVMVYATLGIGSQYNGSRIGILVKLGAAVVAIIIFWDVKPVFYSIWAPFRWLVAYTDPRRPGSDDLHEWYFRSGLDRYVWIHGMFAAWVHPHIESFWKVVDASKPTAKLAARTALMCIIAVSAHQWYTHIYTLPKDQYNAVHPYTSWIPITLWVLARNFLPELRAYSLGLFGWLGCITLETYLSQFHTWLHSNIPDGQPKYLLNLVPGYPLVNFAVVSGVYVYASWRLFNLTNIFKNAAVPHSDNVKLGQNMLLMALVGAFLFSIASVMHAFVHL